MTKRKYFGLFLIIGIVLAFFVYNYMYQDHRNISTEKASYIVSSSNIVNEFINDADVATQKYLDKTIQVNGIVTEADQESIILDSYILCYVDSLTLKSIQKDQKVSVKGRFIGFDELLENIKLDQVSILK